jgi:hypothetical protein
MWPACPVQENVCIIQQYPHERTIDVLGAKKSCVWLGLPGIGKSVSSSLVLMELIRKLGGIIVREAHRGTGRSEAIPEATAQELCRCSPSSNADADLRGLHRALLHNTARFRHQLDCTRIMYCRCDDRQCAVQ